MKPAPASQTQVAAGRLREIVAAVLGMDAGEIAADASFYGDLAADSLEKLEISVRIERAFAVQFDPDEVAALGSVTDALALLRRKGAVA